MIELWQGFVSTPAIVSRDRFAMLIAHDYILRSESKPEMAFPTTTLRVRKRHFLKEDAVCAIKTSVLRQSSSQNTSSRYTPRESNYRPFMRLDQGASMQQCGVVAFATKSARLALSRAAACVSAFHHSKRLRAAIYWSHWPQKYQNDFQHLQIIISNLASFSYVSFSLLTSSHFAIALRPVS